jgi:hypothetical protein
MAIQLSSLAEESALASGDPVFCGSCNAIFNKFSKICEENGEQTWTCEFCQYKNEVVLDQNEVPTQESVNYILENEVLVEEEKGADKKVKIESDAPIIFCLDTSGSMNAAIDNSNRANKASMNARSFRVPKMTRISAICNGIRKQISEMRETKRKVGLVTFNSVIEVIGDGSEKSKIIGKFIWYNSDRQ